MVRADVSGDRAGARLSDTTNFDTTDQVEKETMSDKPEGPGWWLASDGTWHPPELYPSVQVEKKAPIPVPELPVWSGESDPRAEAGPMYPDLFQQAVAGSSLANVVTVNYSDGEPRPGLDVLTPAGHVGDPSDGGQDLMSSARVPAEVGAFTGASAKRRWRIHH